MSESVVNRLEEALEESFTPIPAFPHPGRRRIVLPVKGNGSSSLVWRSSVRRTMSDRPQRSPLSRWLLEEGV